MSVVDRVHGGLVFPRRARVLSDHLGSLVRDDDTSLLDVGCGDGMIARMIHERRPDVSVRGVDVLVRPRSYIPVTAYDGEHLPFEDGSVDDVMLVDVLHHTDDPTVVLRECARVARRAVLVKDHLLKGFLAQSTLRFMDWVGNARHGVRLPYNYWPPARWKSAFAECGLRVAHIRTRLDLYPVPLNFVFERSLHFVARLEITDDSRDRSSSS